MNAFVRQIAVLSVLWAFCELLLPDGRQQRMARLTVSLLVMTALLSALNGLLGHSLWAGWPAGTVLARGEGGGQADRVALQAMANQARGYCVRFAEKAGYAADCAVTLKADGGLHQATLTLGLKADTPPLMDVETLRAKLAQALSTDAERLTVALNGGEGAAFPAGESGP